MVFNARHDDGRGHWAFAKTDFPFYRGGTNPRQGEIVIGCEIETAVISLTELGQIRIEK